MTALTTETVTPDQPLPAPEGTDPSRRIDASRMKSPVAMAALAASAVGAVGMTLGTVVAGKLAEDPTRSLVGWLAICLLGAAVVDTAGKIAWVGCSDRAEGRLREDLLRAALRQPMSALNEQAVGEVLDRIDDDSHEVGNLVRWQIWMLARTLFATVPMWVVAGYKWWASLIWFPVLASVGWLVIRSLLGEIARRLVVE
jgi:ABC-type multidrug transport system fused ATPase/permease subunit